MRERREKKEEENLTILAELAEGLASPCPQLFIPCRPWPLFRGLIRFPPIGAVERCHSTSFNPLRLTAANIGMPSASGKVVQHDASRT